jgi:ligand-binding sensor domain-containing protein
MAILRDRAGTLWGGTSRGLVRREVGATEFTAVVLPTRHETAPSVTSLLQDSSGRIWAGGTNVAPDTAEIAHLDPL